MPREIKHHDKILEAIRESDILSELVEKHQGHFKHELDMEVIVYGRNYAGKQVGPYARLLVFGPGEEIFSEDDWRANTFYVLIEGKLNVYVNNKQGGRDKGEDIQPKNSFGVTSVLAGRQREATIVVSDSGEARVLEIQRPALRLLRKLEKFGRLLDEDCRQHGLELALFDIQEATDNGFSDQLLLKLKEAARFSIYAKGHILFTEGDPIDRLIFINNGWVRRVRGMASDSVMVYQIAFNPMVPDMVMKLDKDVGLDYLGPGNWLGLDATKSPEQARWNYSAIIMARTEVIEITISKLRSDPALLEMIKEHFPHFSSADDEPPKPPADKKSVAAEGQEIAEGIVDGTNVLVMDMDLCIRCGNCSLACHKVHGHSRLLRRGIHISRPVKPQSRFTQHVLMPSVCLHCQDPECLTGCPTGAIERYDAGHVDIDRETCIGCGDCATQCPYNAISMIPRQPAAAPPRSFGSILKSCFSLAPPEEPPAVTETDKLLAIKCNLCENTPLNPAGTERHAYSCQENCPTGALVRVNPREYFTEAQNSIGSIFRDQTFPIGRNIHKRDIIAWIFHIVGVLAIISITWAALWAARRYTLDAHLSGTWVTVRWITGLIGVGGIAFVMFYPARKQIYKRRAGPLRYWLLAHYYMGVIAAIVLLIHGGRDSGGLVTSLLMVSFDVVVVSGLFGMFCYLVVPRIMTSIECDPLLIEDLRERREELRRELGLIDTSDPELRHLIKVKMRKRFFSFLYLMRQYVLREDLKKLLAKARKEFLEDAERLNDKKAHNSLMEAVEATVTLRRVDSLIYLHQLLRLWLAPHVVSTAIMLALMVVHIVQVILFTVR
ncbi:MAG: cyclic nucleotide-binding domain-containing protein [Pyrinomonadaceae bacterium]|nr:cyclic nucleotide-binding domain-containing protein [Pyrinomonadaceae bacterium]